MLLVSWHSLLNTIKADGVKLGSRQNTNKISTSALLCLIGGGRNSGEKFIKIIDARVGANAYSNIRKKHAVLLKMLEDFNE